MCKFLFSFSPSTTHISAEGCWLLFVVVPIICKNLQHKKTSKASKHQYNMDSIKILTLLDYHKWANWFSTTLCVCLFVHWWLCFTCIAWYSSSSSTAWWFLCCTNVCTHMLCDVHNMWESIKLHFDMQHICAVHNPVTCVFCCFFSSIGYTFTSHDIHSISKLYPCNSIEFVYHLCILNVDYEYGHQKSCFKVFFLLLLVNCDESQSNYKKMD